MILLIGVLLALGSRLPVKAQVDSCEAVREALAAGMQADTCQTVAEDSACYASESLETQLRKTWLFFQAPNDRVPVVDIRELKTQGPFGAAVMYVNTAYDPVKVIVFGDAAVDPGEGAVFTMRKQGGKLLCEKTPSGMMVQTRHGETGQVVVNGVTIKLASTAFISVEGVVLFDSDPRVERREGQRNPDAPLCSGFDSECNFDNCPLGYRLVWGPYCREDWYPYIEPGLYRITLDGVGSVEAGATDYNATQQLFAYGSQNLTLPASYTFCYPSLQAGGTGFETIVRTRSADARVDRIAVEYLGRDCDRAWTEAGGEFSIMTVTNMEGSVTVSALGDAVVLEPGEQVRIILQNGVPVEIGQPYVADALFNSSTLGWLGSDPSALPSVNIGPPLPPTLGTSGSSGASSLAGKILFFSSRNYEANRNAEELNDTVDFIPHDLYAVNPDGSNEEIVIPSVPAQFYQSDFAISPDGTRIAQHYLITDGPNSTSREQGVVIRDLRTGSSVNMPMVEELASVHEWSPDGRSLLISIRRQPEATEATASSSSTIESVLARLDLDSGTLTDLFVDPENWITFGSWSPDGTRIAATIHYELWLMNSDGSDKRKISVDTGVPYIRDVAWSPDGNWIAFEAGSTEDQDIWIARPDGSEPQNLTNSRSATDYGPAWSPDGHKIAYSTQDFTSNSGTFKIYENLHMVDVSTGETTQLTFEGRRNASPVWVPEMESAPQGRTVSGTTDEDLLTAIYGDLPQFRLGVDSDGSTRAYVFLSSAHFGGPRSNTTTAKIVLEVPYQQHGTDKLFVVTQLTPDGEFSSRLDYPGVGAAVVAKVGGIWRVEAVTPIISSVFGMWGEIYTGKLIQIGADDFAIQFDTYLGGGPMGFMLNGYALLSPVGDSVALVFSETTDMTNTYACGEDPAGCYSWASQLKLTPDPDRTIYDIVIDSQGTRVPEGGKVVKSFAERKIYRFNGTQYELISTAPLDSTTQNEAEIATAPDDTQAVQRLLTEWDEVYRLSITAVVDDRLPDVAAGEALSHQQESVKRLHDANCYWEVTDLAPSTVDGIEFVSATEAHVRVTKNWDMNLICNGKRAEMPDYDGEFTATYTVQKLPQGWRVVKKETE